MTTVNHRNFLVRFAIPQFNMSEEIYTYSIGCLYFETEDEAFQAYQLMIRGSNFINVEIYSCTEEREIAQWVFKDQPEWKEWISNEEEPSEA